MHGCCRTLFGCKHCAHWLHVTISTIHTLAFKANYKHILWHVITCKLYSVHNTDHHNKDVIINKDQLCADLANRFVTDKMYCRPSLNRCSSPLTAPLNIR